MNRDEGAALSFLDWCVWGQACVRGGGRGVPRSPRAHLGEADVGGDPVSDGEGHDVPGNQFSGEQMLELPVPDAAGAGETAAWGHWLGRPRMDAARAGARVSPSRASPRRFRVLLFFKLGDTKSLEDPGPHLSSEAPAVYSAWSKARLPALWKLPQGRAALVRPPNEATSCA